VSEGVESDIFDSGIAKFFSYLLALSLEDASLVPGASWKHFF